MSNFWNKFFIISCKKYCEFVSKDLDKLPMTPHERRCMKFHHLICSFCRRYNRQIRLIEESAKKLLLGNSELQRQESLSETAKERIKSKISSELPKS